MPDYLSPSEIDLLALMADMDVSPFEDKPVKVQAGFKEAVTDSNALPIINYLLIMLPFIMAQKYNCKVNEAHQRKLIGLKAQYDSFFEPFLDKLAEIGEPNISQLRETLAYKHIPFGPEALLRLSYIIYKNRADLRAYVSQDAWKVIANIFKIMVSDEGLPENTIEWLHSKSTLLPNKLLGLMVRSIQENQVELETDDIPDKIEEPEALQRRVMDEVEEEDESPFLPPKQEKAPKKKKSDITPEEAPEVLKVARRDINAITKKYCRKTDLTPDEEKEFQEKYPEKYKEYRKAINVTSRAQKVIVEDAFAKKGYTIVDVSVARKVLEELGIPDPIDKGFIGKVGPGRTPSAMFVYYTKSGLELDKPPTANVVMNPKYTDEEDCYYCTHIPKYSKKREPLRIYTMVHWQNSKKKLFNSLMNCVRVLPEVRAELSTAIKPILNRNFTSVNALAALVLKVIDETAGRIGNAKSEREEETNGIYNLKVKNLKASVKRNNITMVLSYIGKKGVPQSHKLENVETMLAIAQLIEGRKPEDYIFSSTGEKPVSPSTISKYLKALGWDKDAGPHMFRKVWAASIFNDFAIKGLLELKKSGQLTEKLAKERFQKATEEVAKKLGQTEKNTSVKSYIDPELLKEYWKIAGYKIPAVAQKVIDAWVGDGDDD